MAADVTHVAHHLFSINDVQGGFNGDTYADNPAIICGLGGSPACPEGKEGLYLPQPESMKLPDGSMLTLYPINSEFGFKVSDFVGAAAKEFDDKIDDGSGTLVTYYGEGWIANLPAGGVAVSNASTDTFKVKPPMGTWCSGLGATSVKCSTEHYSVLEHVKTCYETIPYFYADPITGVQADLFDPEDGQKVGTCDLGKLDNALYEVVNGVISDTALVPGDDGNPDLPPNESTVRDDIAVSADYAITKKDDGKPLYRWGDLIKRPNDVRLYARMALPAEWKNNPDKEYKVKDAWLSIVHTITNNPNDQIRPEDMENEGATGKLPEHTGVGDSVWTSAKDCYEGDGDFIPMGTVLKNPGFKVDSSSTDPYAFSEDLREGLTNAWYTTTDRDPFDWDPVSGLGPRWRMLANKFGQDIPGLEIPLDECSPVPFSSSNIRYPTGDDNVVTIDLLDFEDDASPLKRSSGWIDNARNFQNLCPGEPPESGECAVSVNGLPMTEDFDLAIYIKGDKKPTVIKDVWLSIIYESEPISDTAKDIAMTSLSVPDIAVIGSTVKITGTYANEGTVPVSGVIQLGGSTFDGGVWELVHDDYFYVSFTDLAPGATANFEIEWTVEATIANDAIVYWYATAWPDGGDDDSTNNSAWDAVTVVQPDL